MWTDPIYDRTQDDITNRTSKGFFNVVDWIRINGNTQCINALVNVLRALDIEFTSLSAPSITSIPTAQDVNAFVLNIERILAVCGIPAATGLVALKTNYVGGLNDTQISYTTVNDWERDIQLIRDYILTTSDYMVYCGVPEPGQVRFYQARFRHYPYIQPSDTPARIARTGIAVSGSGLMRLNKWRRYDP